MRKIEMTDFTVKTGKEDDGTLRTVTVNYSIPESLQEMVGKYGEDTVYEFANRAVTQAVQNIARVRLNEDASEEDCQKAVSEWIPGVRGTANRKTPKERAIAALGSLNAEELAELLLKVKAAEKAAKSA
jgi:hypothetical protein